jgi:serine/threonine protein kinase
VGWCDKCGEEYPDDTIRCPKDGALLVDQSPTDVIYAQSEALQVHDVLTPGVVVGEYVVAAKIGEGGMGTVFAGEHPVIGKKVAIKVLHPALSRRPAMVQRFVQEARAVNRIGHRNIVDIFAFGQLDSGEHYFIMELLAGETLGARLRRDPPLGYAEAFRILGDIASALAAAHEAGIVHRDLKPDNIFLAESKGAAPTVKLLDFGIAKLVRETELDANVTGTGAPLGTPYYMSPEQGRGDMVDAQTDLYSLGVIMFEMFAGRVPFSGNGFIDIINAHAAEAIPSMSALCADVPTAMEQLVTRCLAKHPADRPDNAVRVAGELGAIAARLDGQPRFLPSRRGAPDVSSRSLSTAPARLTRPADAARRRRRQLVALALLGIAAAGAGIVAGGWRPGARVARDRGARVEVQIITDPPGARVTIDGERQALRTPAQFRVARAPSLAIRLEREGYRTHEQLLELPADEQHPSLLVSLRPLVPEAGALHIRTNARVASWTVDGAAASDRAGTLDLAEVTPGPHRVRVEANGFDAHEEQVDVTAGRRTAREWTLAPVGSPARRRPAERRPDLPDAPTLDFKPPPR